MFLYRKNIILVPSDYDGVSLTKGLLSLDCFDDKTECSLRCYNLFISKPLVLGVSINNNLNKIQVNQAETKNFKFVIDQKIKNTDEISCVLLNLKQNGYDIELWGSTQINSGWKSTLKLMLEDELFLKDREEVTDTQNLAEEINNKFDTTTKNFDISKQTAEQDLFCQNNNKPVLDDSYTYQNQNFVNKDDTLINNFNNDSDKNSTNTSFKFNQNLNQSFDEKNQADAEIYSYEDEKINAFIDKVIDMTEDREYGNIKKDASELTFYERINPQIEKMFANNKAETVLNEILPNSKFCKVEFDDGSGYYVFGIIYDDGTPKYLCYGLPAQRDSEPPTELSNLYQWLPIDATDENGDGYYMMYQDAVTGKNISVEII